MSDFINFTLLLLFSMVIILGIIFVGGIIYWIIWTALYIPINKKFKYDERVSERDQEYNKLEVEHANLVKFTEEQRVIYESFAVKKQAVLDEISDKEKELKRKQGIIKDAEDTIKLMNAFLDSSEGKRWKQKVTKSNEKTNDD